jgi:hypothetical protein
MAQQRRDPNAWVDLPLDRGLFANLDPDAVVQHQTAVENGFINELGGHTRFPGLETFVDLRTQFNDNGRMYLSDFEGDMIVASSRGQVYRIAENAAVTPCTGVPVSGGGRAIMAPTDKEMLFAAGGDIVRLRQAKTEILSEDAPQATYVGWIDGIAVANQVNTFNFFSSNPGFIDQWPALNSDSADSDPNPITCFMINAYRQLIFGGPDKFEQWERNTNGTALFYRRWSIGDGALTPYLFLFADNGMWTVNSKLELVKFLAQVSQNVSNEIGLLLANIDDWTDAWMGGYPDQPLHLLGQKFILFQMPYATNEYSTKGVTIVFDYRNKKFFQLYGWDNAVGQPARWPGWSHWPLWKRVFVGGEGKIYRFTTDSYWLDGAMSRWLIRTAHIAQGNQVSIEDFRLQLTRGRGTPTKAPTIAVRARRDGKAFGPWIKRDLGVAGDNIQFKNFGPFGTGTTFQWEIMCSDDAPVNLIKAQVRATAIG